MTRPLTKLEWLGVESAFRNLFYPRHAQAVLFTLLVRRAGTVASYETILDACRLERCDRPGRPWWENASKAVSRLRRLLADWGEGDVIETVPGEGFSIGRIAAARLLRQLDECCGGGLLP